MPDLEAAVQGVGKAIAELKGAQLMQQPEMILLEKAEAIPDWTKLAIEEMAKLNATPEQKKEFVDAVKRVSAPDPFFYVIHYRLVMAMRKIILMPKRRSTI